MAVRTSLLERFSGKFRRCWKIIPRFSGSTECYACQGLGTFRRGKRLLENWRRLRERCWIFSSKAATAFLSSSEQKNQKTENTSTFFWRPLWDNRPRDEPSPVPSTNGTYSDIMAILLRNWTENGRFVPGTGPVSEYKGVAGRDAMVHKRRRNSSHKELAAMHLPLSFRVSRCNYCVSSRDPFYFDPNTPP